jgi:hypothetical protein
MDLVEHQILILVDAQLVKSFSMQVGRSSTAMAGDVLGAVAELGLTGEVAREKFESDEPREYDPDQAGRFLTALVNAHRIFSAHRAKLRGDVGPVQFWPHGFDLAFEWHGTRVETYEEDGEIQEYPSQINLGFYPGGTAEAQYFYSNPWPFEASELLDKPLPGGASWHTEGWQGTLLPYEELVDNDEAEARLREYARAVFEISSPTLLV